MNYNQFIIKQRENGNINYDESKAPAQATTKIARNYRRELRNKRKDLQKQSITTAYKHKKSITDEDIIYFIRESAGTDKTKDVKILYNIATYLKRRLGAIEWWYNFTWNVNKYLESISIKDFKKTKKLIGRLQALKAKLGY